jgi:bacteriocin-like protein
MTEETTAKEELTEKELNGVAGGLSNSGTILTSP